MQILVRRRGGVERHEEEEGWNVKRRALVRGEECKEKGENYKRKI
jgi:hypothetical protein